MHNNLSSYDDCTLTDSKKQLNVLFVFLIIE